MKLNHDRQMRKSIAIIITSILVLSGCNKQQSVSDRLLNEVGKVIAINPDSASNLLKGISSPEKLPLHAGVCYQERLQTRFSPPSYQLIN